KEKENVDEITKVPGIDHDELLMADERIDMIARHINENHHKKTHGRIYTGMFTVAGIKAAIKYYDAFKRLGSDLRIAAIFTWNPNEESIENEEHSRHSLDRMIADYNKQFGTNHSTENFAAYFSDVSDKVKSAQ